MATARKKKTAKAAPKRSKASTEKRRFWLTYPSKLITAPVMWQLGRRFEVITNIRQASVSDELGIVCLELEGERSVVKKAMSWLEKQGVRVEPVEINVLES